MIQKKQEKNEGKKEYQRLTAPAGWDRVGGHTDFAEPGIVAVDQAEHIPEAGGSSAAVEGQRSEGPQTLGRSPAERRTFLVDV